MRPRLAVAALAAAVAVAGGITAGILTTRQPTTATGTAVATTHPPVTTSAPAPTTTTGETTQTTPTTATGPPRIFDPTRAASHLFAAWQAGDRQRALQAATPSAVRALFAIAPSPQPRFTGCTDRGTHDDCYYTYPRGTGPDSVYDIDMRVEGGASTGYRVVAVEAPLLFVSPDAAAKYLMSAWLANDRAAARNAAATTAIDTLWNRLRDRNQPPRFAGCTYRHFGFDCTYSDTTVPLGLSMRVVGGASVGFGVEAVRFADA